MSKYIVTEMQDGNINGHTWAYDTREDAEVRFFQVLAETVKSPIAVHTVILHTDEGFVLDCKCYKHEATIETEVHEEA